jgi:Barstar (barnase inhibitor)
MQTFDYRRASDPEVAADFVIKIPQRRYSRDTLLSTLSREGRFPNIVTNWDALLDALRDLSWIGGRRVALVHASLPLEEEPPQCRTYLAVLSTAVQDWRTAKSSNILPALRWKYVDHDFFVIFPTEAKGQIEELRLE